jgi:hypothetical protein
MAQNSAARLARMAQLSCFSKRITCKIASSYVERDAIFKLRHQCYLRAGLISQNSFGRYIEATDHAPNTCLIGLYDDRKLLSTLRLQIGSPTSSNLSSLQLFPKRLAALVRSSRTIVDMSCVATDRGLSALHIWLPYLTLRPWITAAEHFKADYIVTATRPQHRPFYQHALGCEAYLHLRRPVHHLGSAALVSLNFATSAKRLYENLPFLRSTPSERQQLFARDATPPMASRPHTSVS